ncbi:MAG TPA: polysaccharide biosynthesis tyrosine autokinase [Mucilaginibacter sp.]|jgi:tyrosine-protein kinase Etk/Wzc|nr:polysaccharide biosynthesis tyrosine autokinase [Mucilaginibacter sp.]
MEETENIQHRLPNQEIDYFKIIKIFLSRWYWIAGSVAIALIFANLYLWYTPKTYATSGTMKFEEKRSEMSDLVTVVGSADRGPSRVQTEITVLQSGPLLLNAVRHLDFRISFYIVGRVLNRTNELYPQKPLDVELVRFDSLNFFHDMLTFKPIDRNTFYISYKSGGKDIQKSFHYNVPFNMGPTFFSIKYPGDLPKTAIFLFKLNAAEDFVGRVRGGLHIAETGKNSNIISLQETDSNPQFAADVLNSLMSEYLTYDKNQRTKSASQMINFIDNQLAFLSTEVKGSENSIEQYKEHKRILDLGTAAGIAFSKQTELKAQQALLRVQLLEMDQLKQDIVNKKDNVNLNFDLGGVVNQPLSDIINKLNGLLAQKTALSKTYNDNSQPIQDLNQQILQIKSNTLTTINATRESIQNKIKYLQNQLAPVDQQISALPSAQRDLLNLQRDFEINDKVYSFLSEKKLDAQISSAGILPGATIIDRAQVNLGPVAPNEYAIRRSAVILGLIVGLGLIFLIRVLNPYIYDKETIESLTSIPIIGVIRKFPGEIDEFSSQILAISKPKSIFAESVRSVRTNLSFLASEKESKVICITSEVAGEGKSFVAINLSSTLSLIDKKVILIAADLRRSKLHKTFRAPNDVGLSNYLAHQCEAEDIINHSDLENLDFIISGPIPPNPSELLHSERMTGLIARLKLTYDIIMIDTAPIGLVSDAIPLIRMSDVNLFVIRSGKSKFYAATVPQRIVQEYHLNNTVIVLNAFAEDVLHSRYYTTKFTGESYGSRYYYYSDYSGYESSGYYIDEQGKNWWNIKRWFK